MSGQKETSAKEGSRDFFRQERARMIEEQLTPRGIRDSRVLDAMATVPRERFVPREYRVLAYRDAPLPIGFGQTISQPYAVAFMVESLKLSGAEKVLEIGTGSGYQAAVLSHLAKEVHTIERIDDLYKRSKKKLQQMKFDNVHVHLANGTLGLPGDAPFDAIGVTASSETLPPPLVEQLADGGRIVIPLGQERQTQRMFRYTLSKGNLKCEDLGGFTFVPLIGEFGWSEHDAEC